MKRLAYILAGAALAAVACTTTLFAQLNIPSDGSDGALVITSDTVIDLSKATNGVSSDNNSANHGNGIYDTNRWAVVFKYSSVSIASGATVTFSNHPSHAPVVWLVNGDVTIDGVLSLNGHDSVPAPGLGEPGPGGFRGGTAVYASGVGRSSGFGPGGGGYNPNDGNQGAGGSFGSSGAYGPVPYGNPSLIPLIGGSGGGGTAYSYQGGSGGGGAILIASSGTLSVKGTISANGGNSTYGYSGSGSGGGVRLVASTLTDGGTVQAIAGAGSNLPGGLGRIRIERVTNTSSLQITPDPSVVTLQSGATPQIWLPDDGPTARIVSIGALAAPADPRASFGASGADVTLPQVATTPVLVETTNAEDASIVTVRVSPRANGIYTETVATLSQTNSVNPLVLLWTANVPVNAGYSAVQVKVARP